MNGAERYIDRNPDLTSYPPVDFFDYERADRPTLIKQARALELWLMRREFDGKFIRFTATDDSGGMEIAILPLSPNHRIRVVKLMAREWQEHDRATGLWWCITDQATLPGQFPRGVHVAEWLAK